MRHIYAQQLVASNFANNRENFQQKLFMFERYYLYFHYSLCSYRYVMFQKRILSKPKWGAPASRPPLATSIATALIGSRASMCDVMILFS